MLRSDVQIIAQAEGTSSGSLPSKLPNILAANKKLLVITDANSELSELLSNCKGVSINTSWENNRLIESMKELLNDDCFSHDNSRERVLELLNIDSVTRMLL